MIDYFAFPKWAYPLLAGKPPPARELTFPEAEAVAKQLAEVAPPRRGRGRPPGAKNRPK